MVTAIEQSTGFNLVRWNALKRNPKDFPAGHKYDELLRLKDFGVEKPIDIRAFNGDDNALLEAVVADLKSTYPLVEILNRAINYAYEEMM